MNWKICVAAWLIVVSALSIAPVLAQGETAGPVDLDALKWAELPNGVKIAVFMGNPKEPGPYGSRAKLPPNWRVAPHTHPEQGRVTTVISGKLYWASGDVFDESNMQDWVRAAWSSSRRASRITP